MLANFLRSEQGAELLRGSADALGVSGAAFIARVEALGEIEIVVPIREHRLAWTGTPRIGVGGSWDADVIDFVVHEPSGLGRRARSLDGLMGYDALFLIRPKETIGTRMARQADVPGSVIQDPDDGELALVWTLQVGDEKPKSVDYGRFDSEEELRSYIAVTFGSNGLVLADGADCNTESTIDECDGGGPGGGGNNAEVASSPTWLDAFAMTAATDNIGTEEVEITVGYTNSSGTWVRGTKRYEGVQPFVSFTAGLPDEMLPVSPAAGGATFEVSAIETDFLFDDDLGWATFDYDSGPRSYWLSGIVVDLDW